MLVDEKRDMGQQCVLAAPCPGLHQHRVGSKTKEGIVPLCSALVGTPLSGAGGIGQGERLEAKRGEI